MHSQKTLNQCVFAEAETEQNLSISSRISRDYKCSSLDAGQANHDEVHPVTVVNRFPRGRVAVDLLSSNLVTFGVPQHQTIYTAN